MHIAGGTLGPPWNNSIAAYLNGGTIEYSIDGIAWIFYATIAGVTDLPNSPKQYYPQISAQYWRISRPSFLAISEWRFFTQIDEYTMPIALSFEVGEVVVSAMAGNMALTVDMAEIVMDSLIPGLAFSMTVTEITPLDITHSISVRPTIT
jgi:hypothetical protein